MRHLIALLFLLLWNQSTFASPKLIELGNLSISMPDDADKKAYPMIILFGGSMWADKYFMINNTPESYFNSSIIVYSPCYDHGGGNLRIVEQKLNNFLIQKGIRYSSKSACGFSGGGPDAMIAENPKSYKALGFIDPCPVANGTIKFSSNMILSFNRSNWVNSDYFGKIVNFKHFNELSANIKKAGGTVEEAKVKHQPYFRYFLEKFKKQLIG
jgi:hypothetical protein